MSSPPTSYPVDLDMSAQSLSLPNSTGYEEGNESFHGLPVADDQTYMTGHDTAGGMTMVTVDNDDDDNAVPDMLLLNLYCARAKAPKDSSSEGAIAEADASWQPVRDWLASHSAEEVRAAAEQRGESGLTALHFACRHCPPADVIDLLLSIARDTVTWPDRFQWLPIHYACASGSDSAVIHALVESYPDCKTKTDARGRTPLHFALGDKPASPDIIFLLSSTGAAEYQDDIGMLPLHYACAFGASEEVLYVLTDVYSAAITTGDHRKRTPLHFALSNAGRKTVPSAVRLLLSLNRSIVNSINGGPLPLRVLAEYATTVRNDDNDNDLRQERRESVKRCLEHLLNAEPDPTADFFTALQSLPDWLSEHAVVMPVVQNLLNEKISQRFPTAVLMLDFFVLAMVIIYYSISVTESIEKRAAPGSEKAIKFTLLLPLYLGVGYFFMREVMQIISLISLKVFKLWLHDASNYLNIAFVGLVLVWTVIMQRGAVNDDAFRIGAAVSVTILWVKLLAYLRSLLIDFAVFVGGVFYVVRRLAAFLISLSVILFAFAQMFFTTFQMTPYCLNRVEAFETEGVMRPYCNFWTSFLSVYTMLLGEVDETAFTSSNVATALFILFMFLVVILLANVLIAIVTDSYKVIQDQKASIVFWTNRLDFVAEMDAIANGPWKHRIKKALGFREGNDSSNTTGRPEVAFGKELWKHIMDLYEEDVYESTMSIDFVVYTILRAVAAIFIIPGWVILGIFTAGWLWPPQLREMVFHSTVAKHSSDLEQEDEQRKTQVKQLQHEVGVLKDDLLQELAMDRTQVVQMKSQVAERKLEIANEMKDIKRLVALMFERQGRM